MTTGPSGGVAASRLAEERRSWRKVGNCNATGCLAIWVLQRVVLGCICFGFELAWPRRPAEECNTTWLNSDREASRVRPAFQLSLETVQLLRGVHSPPAQWYPLLPWQAAPPVLAAVPLKLPNSVSSITSQGCKPYCSNWSRALLVTSRVPLLSAPPPLCTTFPLRSPLHPQDHQLASSPISAGT